MYLSRRQDKKIDTYDGMSGAGNACPPACLPLVGTGGALPVNNNKRIKC